MNKTVIKVLFFALIFVALGAATAFLPKETVSYNENRALAVMPSFSPSSYLDESFMNGVSEYISDHFAFREYFVKAKNELEKAVGKDEINGICTVEDRMIQVFRNTDDELTQRNISAVEALAERSNVPVFFALAPTSQEIYRDSLPRYQNEKSESEYIAACYKESPNCVPVDLISPLSNEKGDYIYYRTDHHWTSIGAFYAYEAIAQKLGIVPYSLESFNVEYVTDDFRGTLFSKTLDKSVTPDTIGCFTLKNNEPEITLHYNGKKGSMYYPDKLNEKDKYAYFLGNNKGVLKLDNETISESKNLLVIKDSYANSLLPFLARHYSLVTVIDPRYATVNEIAVINPDSYDAVLVLYNVIGFSEEETVTKIKFVGK